ncbi:integrin beta-1-like protein [Anopheles sinensis]|uniref:Integrin beta-1-like protein n=1 Tax=Anopheles sinensis TaxID=74873 RepID=A0A084VI39_ANOSI|nr:integrin beta-1-like protein [Anopheles sinensis]
MFRFATAGPQFRSSYSPSPAQNRGPKWNARNPNHPSKLRQMLRPPMGRETARQRGVCWGRNNANCPTAGATALSGQEFSIPQSDSGSFPSDEQKHAERRNIVTRQKPNQPISFHPVRGLASVPDLPVPKRLGPHHRP